MKAALSSTVTYYLNNASVCIGTPRPNTLSTNRPFVTKM